MQPSEKNPIKVKLEDVREERSLANLAQLIHDERLNTTTSRFEDAGDEQKSGSSVKTDIDRSWWVLLVG